MLRLKGESKAKMLARATLESLLRERKLDSTLAVFPLPGDEARAADAVVPTGHGRADQALGGGWPRGQLSTLSGPVSSGRTTLMAGTLAAATGDGELAALVDAADCFDPVPAAARGVVLERVLWVRGVVASVASVGSVAVGAAGRVGASRRPGLERALVQSIRAFDLMLRAGGFAVVVLDVSGVPARALANLPLPTWLRLGRSVEHSRTAAVVVADAPVARSAGGASLVLQPGPARWRGASDNARVFDGPAVAPAVRGFRKVGRDFNPGAGAAP